MAADWTKPDLDSNYETEVLQQINAKVVEAATLFYAVGTGIPNHAIRWNRSTLVFEEWDGAVWNELASGLTLGTMSTQDSDNVSITGGTIGTLVNIDAARLTSNTVPTARLGSGSALAGSALAGDQSWKSFPPIGTGAIWFTASAPTGWLLLNGQAVSRTTYSVLFALWSTTFGVGDGSTTFNVPDLRGYFPFGKAAAGTGSTLGGTFGVINHLHTGPSHTHTVASHTHTGPSHTHDLGNHTHGMDHDHTFSSSHTHGFSGTTGEESDITSILSGGVHAAGIHHTHTFSGTTDAGTASGTTSNASSVDTAVPSTNTTSASGTGATGAASPATDASGTGNTGTGNPPGFAVNFIVKAL